MTEEKAELIFDHPQCQVWFGDWRTIGLESVDGSLTDPPYTGHVHNNVRSCSTNGDLKVVKYDIDFDAIDDDLSHVPILLDISKRWVINFCALEQLGDYRRAAGGDRARGKGEPIASYNARRAGFVRSGIWRKKQAAPQLSGDRPANSCEAFAVMYPRAGRMSWGGRGAHAYLSSHQEDEGKPFFVPDFIEEGRERGKKRHPAQKPAALCERMAAWFVQPGETWLDAYAGSGNLGFACLRLGAKVILVDNDPEWAMYCAHRAPEEIELAKVTAPR